MSPAPYLWAQAEGACGWSGPFRGSRIEEYVMSITRLAPSVWFAAACLLLAGCATQQSEGPAAAYGYGAGPGFNAPGSPTGIRALPEAAGEAPQGRDLVQFPNTFATGEVIVSFADRRLYYVEARGRALSYPIAIPRDQDRWEGVTKVSDKKVNPAWTPTQEMLRENPKLPPFVPGGHPMNPLGVRALYLGTTTYRIHGTDAPWTIGDAASKGCIRMFNEHVLELYDRVPVGTRVTVTWNRFGVVRQGT
jgi:lipoprotein-anchoring transpeptidase ErfK/SrfK